MEPRAYRERVYDIFIDPDEDVGERVDRAFAVGIEYLDLPIAFLTRIDGGTQEIVQAVGDHHLIQPGERCPLEEAYCRRTVEIESVLAIEDATASPDVAAAAVATFDLGAYVGAKVVVDDETYGTVCFAAEDEREDAFTDPERYFVELLAGLVGQALERRASRRDLERRERQLEERQEVYRAVVEASFDLVFRVDAAGRFTYFSPPVEQLLGHDPDEVVGREFGVILPDGETTEAATDLFEQVMAGETVEHQYFPLTHRNGSRIFVDFRATPLYESGIDSDERTPENVVGAQGVAHDATTRYRRERVIEVLNRVLRHNLRNDMTVIRGFAEALEAETAGDHADMAGRIVATSDRLIQLGETARKLEQNLDSSPELTPADVVPVVDRTATQLRDQYPEATVTVDTPETAVASSAPRLETAVWELADNAAKHGGEEPTVELAVTTSEDRVTVRVADDGAGLTDSEAAALVADEETPLVHGSGLGLWLVNWIVDSLDGDLRTRSTDSGTCIEVCLPRVDGSGE
jgi:PAS domain S-box-containing protein